MKKTALFFWFLFSVSVFSQNEHWFTYEPSFPDVENFEGFFTHSYEIDPLDVIAMANDTQIQNTSLGNYLTFPKRDGLLDGLVIINNPKGQRFEITFEKGKANGKSVIYDTKGNLVLETHYKNNKRNGIRKLYSSYRSYVFEANYVDDKLVGKIKVTENRYNDDWYYLFPNDLKKGTVEAFAYGIKSVEIPIINSKIIHGDVEYFDKTGKVFMTVPYHYGNIHGTVNLKDKEGKDWYSLRFKNGKPIGKHIKYHNDFKTLEKEEYYDEDGKKIGVWKYYDNNQNLVKIIDKYENDSINGFEKTFSDGNLITESHYQNGKKHGKSIRYNSTSQKLLNIGYFENDVQTKNEEFKNGILTKQIVFLNGINQKHLFLDKNGKIIQENLYNEKGQAFGNHKTYNYDNELNYTLLYDEDFDENGIKTKSYVYQYDGSYNKFYFREGKKHGKQTFYHSYNNKTIESYFWNGKQVSEEEFIKLSEAEKSK